MWGFSELCGISRLGGAQEARTMCQAILAFGASAGPWTFAASGALELSPPPARGASSSLSGPLCLEPGAAVPAHEQLVLSACSAKPTAWQAITAPGFPTIAIKGLKGSWGPAVLQGQVVLGQPAILCGATQQAPLR